MGLFTVRLPISCIMRTNRLGNTKRSKVLSTSIRSSALIKIQSVERLAATRQHTPKPMTVFVIYLLRRQRRAFVVIKQADLVSTYLVGDVNIARGEEIWKLRCIFSQALRSFGMSAKESDLITRHSKSIIMEKTSPKCLR